jgi:hypothetical protein
MISPSRAPLGEPFWLVFWARVQAELLLRPKVNKFLMNLNLLTIISRPITYTFDGNGPRFSTAKISGRHVQPVREAPESLDIAEEFAGPNVRKGSRVALRFRYQAYDLYH